MMMSRFMVFYSNQSSGPNTPPSHQDEPPVAGRGGGVKPNQHVKTMMVIELFTTKECPKCVKVKKFLDAQKIGYAERVIDADGEAETDALMLNIFAAPALKIGDLVFKSKDIFNDGELSENIKGLLIETKGID